MRDETLDHVGDIEQKPPFYVLDEFDSALDEERKHEIFDLYRQELGRKLIAVSPKVHGDRYLDRFGKFHCVVANPGAAPDRSVSEVYDVTRENAGKSGSRKSKATAGFKPPESSLINIAPRAFT